MEKEKILFISHRARRWKFYSPTARYANAAGGRLVATSVVHQSRNRLARLRVATDSRHAGSISRQRESPSSKISPSISLSGASKFHRIAERVYTVARPTFPALAPWRTECLFFGGGEVKTIPQHFGYVCTSHPPRNGAWCDFRRQPVQRTAGWITLQSRPEIGTDVMPFRDERRAGTTDRQIQSNESAESTRIARDNECVYDLTCNTLPLFSVSMTLFMPAMEVPFCKSSVVERRTFISSVNNGPGSIGSSDSKSNSLIPPRRIIELLWFLRPSYFNIASWYYAGDYHRDTYGIVINICRRNWEVKKKLRILI